MNIMFWVQYFMKGQDLYNLKKLGNFIKCLGTERSWKLNGTDEVMNENVFPTIVEHMYLWK